MKHVFLWAMCLGMALAAHAQDKKVDIVLYEGIAVLGYVDEGAYLNFTGPGISASYGKSKFLLGLMPSLRFKEDKGTPKNPFVTPSLGLGLTYSYKALAFQIPLYYNPKTGTSDGRWHLGCGIGVKMGWFNKK